MKESFKIHLNHVKSNGFKYSALKLLKHFIFILEDFIFFKFTFLNEK